MSTLSAWARVAGSRMLINQTADSVINPNHMLLRRRATNSENRKSDRSKFVIRKARDRNIVRYERIPRRLKSHADSKWNHRGESDSAWNRLQAANPAYRLIKMQSDRRKP